MVGDLPAGWLKPIVTNLLYIYTELLFFKININVEKN